MLSQWLGTVCLENDECLIYLNRAYSIWLKEEQNNNCSARVLDRVLDVHLKFCMVYKAMGKSVDVVVHEKKVLEIKEKMLEEDCVELGKINQGVYLACFEAMDIEGALPFCRKALEIYEKHFGPDSVEVTKVTMHLARVYSKLGEDKKAFELNQLAVGVLKRVAPNSADMVTAEVDSAHLLFVLGRYEETVDDMERLVSRTDIEKEEKLTLLIALGRALCFMEKFGGAKKYFRAAQRMLEKKDMPRVNWLGVCRTYMSCLYETMNDLDTAISIIKRVLEVPELPQKLLREQSVRFFSLVSLSGKEKEEIPYMAGLVEKLNESLGPEHGQVSHGYAQLGVAYGNAGQAELAAKALRNAKDVLDVYLGPHHLTSLKINHGLSVTYAGLGRFDEAFEIAEKVAEGLKGLAPSERGFMHEVSKHLSKMKKRVAESSTTASSRSKDD